MNPEKLVSNDSHSYSLYCADGVAHKVFEFSVNKDGESLRDWNDSTWKETYGAEAVEAIEECVLNFHEAKHSMQQEVGKLKLVGSEKEVDVKNKKMTPLVMQLEPCNNENEIPYKVTFDCDGRVTDHSFRLRTDGTSITGIDWDEHFWTNLDGELSIAKPLFKAIAAFQKQKQSISST